MKSATQATILQSILVAVLLFVPLSVNLGHSSSPVPSLAQAERGCSPGQIPDGEGGCITYQDPRPPQAGGGSNASSTTTGGGAQDVSCSWASGVQCFIGKLFYYTVFVTFGFLVYIAASFFDFILQLSVIDFHTWVGMPGVRVAWSVLRDTMNIAFIFLLLYASISMILGLGKEKNIIKGVILAGLLINFSFFFTSVIIDVSNVTTVQMYEAIKRIGENASQESSNSDVEARMTGITAVFMQGTGIQVGNIAGLNGKEFTSKLFQQMLFSSIEFLVLAFVFFAMGFLLLGRFIVLLILLVTSPISVMGGLLPQISQYSKQWWKEMINQATFAPIMMLFLVVTAVIISNPQFRDSFSRDSIGGLVGGVQGLAQYAIVIGLLIVGIITAKQSAGAASNGMADWAIKKAQGAPGAIGGFLGRNTIGRGARLAGEKYDVAMGRMSQLTFKDAKGITGVAKFAAGRTIAGIARRTPIDEGIRDTLKATAASKFGSQESLAERERAYIQRTKELGQAVKEAADEEKIGDGLAQTQQDLTNGTYDSTTGKIKDYLDTVAKMTDKQIEELLATGQIEKLKKMAPDLTSKHMDKIMSSDLISDSVKGEIQGKRKGGLIDRVTAGKVANVYQEAKKIASGKPHEVAQLPADVLTNSAVSGHLSANVLAKIAQDGKMSDVDKSTIRANVIAAHTHLSTAATMRTLTPDEQIQLNTLKASTDWLKSDQGLVF